MVQEALAVEKLWPLVLGNSRDVEESRGEVNMSARNLGGDTSWDTRFPDYQGEVGILGVEESFAGWNLMIANMVPVVCREDELGVLYDSLVFKKSDDILHHLINALQGANALAESVICVGLD